MAFASTTWILCIELTSCIYGSPYPGNELCGTGVSARVEAEQYAKDTIALRELVNELYPDPATRPKVLGPAGFYDEQWFNTYLQTTGPNVLDGVTHHIYNLGSGTYTHISFNTQPTSCT